MSRGGRGAANRIRIIGGDHRGRRLGFAPVRGLRPTPDRVRETLFNWLQGEVRGRRCLDLFAGSGALGFECLSRGAAEVVFVERAPRAAALIRDNIGLLGEQGRARVVEDDALRWLARPGERPFDIAFLDPPFAADLLGPALRAVVEAPGIAPGGWLYVEQDSKQAPVDLPDGWETYRLGQAGQTSQRLLRRSITG